VAGCDDAAAAGGSDSCMIGFCLQMRQIDEVILVFQVGLVIIHFDTGQSNVATKI